MTDKSDTNGSGTSELKTAAQLAPSPAPTPSQNQSIGQMRSTIQQQVATTGNPQVLTTPMISATPSDTVAEPITANTDNAVESVQSSQPMQQLPALKPEAPVPQVPAGRRGRGGCLRLIPRLGCRTLGCFGCFLPLVLIFLAALFLLIRPAELWEPFKELLNREVSTQAASQIPLTPNNEANAQLLTGLISQASGGSKKLTLQQSQLAEIFASRIELARGMYVEITEGQLILYRNLEPQGEPLWLIAYFTLADGNFTLSKLKISSVELPEFVRNIARDGLQSGFDFVNLQDPGDLFSKLIQVGQQSADVATIELTAGAVIIELK